MIRLLQLSLLITGTAIVAWNLSAYKSNVRHEDQVKSAFTEFGHNSLQLGRVVDLETHKNLIKAQNNSLLTTGSDSRFSGWNHHIPKVILGSVLIVSGILLFTYKSKK